MNVFIAPRSGEKRYKGNFSTIRNGVNYEKIEKYLDDEGRRKLKSEDQILVWGNRKGLQTSWEKMNDGDIVIFYAHKQLSMAAEVYYKKHDPALALELWPRDENGNPWEYVFFVRNPRYFRIPIEHFNKIVGYKSNYVVQGFSYLNPVLVQKIEDEYGSLDHFLLSFSDSYSPEMPREDEKMHVNIPEDLEVHVIINPTLQPKQPVVLAVVTEAKRKKIDYQEKSRKNAITGNRGEVIVFDKERERLVEAGHKDLADKVERVSTEDDSKGYDILSYEVDGTPRYIEVKTTSQKTEAVSFIFSVNEYKAAKELPNYYVAYVDRIDSKKPRISLIQDPFKNEKFLLTPISYLAEAVRV